MKKRRGLTLIELILSIALLGMMVIVFFTIFNIGNKNIIKAGNRTEQVLNVQEEVDNEIQNHNDMGEDIIKLKFPGIGEKEVRGSLVIRTENGIEITTFIPNKKSK